MKFRYDRFEAALGGYDGGGGLVACARLMKLLLPCCLSPAVQRGVRRPAGELRPRSAARGLQAGRGRGGGGEPAGGRRQTLRRLHQEDRQEQEQILRLSVARQLHPEGWLAAQEIRRLFEEAGRERRRRGGGRRRGSLPPRLC